MKNEHQSVAGAQSGQDNEVLDMLTNRHTGFVTFAEMLDAPGGFWPSLRVSDPEKLVLADAYDKAQAARGDGRRANRYGGEGKDLAIPGAWMPSVGTACHAANEAGADKMRAWLVEFGPVTLREAFHAMDGAEVRAQIDLHYSGGLAAWVVGAASRPVDLLGLVDELRSCLEEAHQQEIDSDHEGDGEEGCSYCAAIARAESALAGMSDPDGAVCCAACGSALGNDCFARDDGSMVCTFCHAVPVELSSPVIPALVAGPVALPPVNGPAGVPSLPVLSFVLDAGGNAVSVECCHSGAHLETIRQNVGNLRLVEVPLALALRAPAMHQALGTISRCIINPDASDESGENSMIELARRALDLA